MAQVQISNTVRLSCPLNGLMYRTALFHHSLLSKHAPLLARLWQSAPLLTNADEQHRHFSQPAQPTAGLTFSEHHIEILEL